MRIVGCLNNEHLSKVLEMGEQSLIERFAYKKGRLIKDIKIHFQTFQDSTIPEAN